MDVSALIDELRPHLNGALVATDFDGTLSPLQRDPEDSRSLPGAVEALTALAHCGAAVAVITGRDARTVVRLGELADIPGLVVAGVYGAETWTGGELSTPDTPEAILALRERLPQALGDADPQVWVEDKRLSLVVHARRAADPDQALADVTGEVSSLADELGLEVHPGSGVLELRLPDFDKASALSSLAEGHNTVLFLGDDLGDLPAFARVRELRESGLHGYSVGVRSSGAEGIADAVDVLVDDPQAVVDLLTDLGR
ncbi:trehalose-phosphatase [uncultured Jatrophihabitans sp.]|uniref:trehalose-phosphatase n=1 Tax=uncultured Jatrophihabitans sp. TaxID=1610747 RepID=UPI0035CAB6FF